jgi:hypothetical protein
MIRSLIHKFLVTFRPSIEAVVMFREKIFDILTGSTASKKCRRQLRRYRLNRFEQICKYFFTAPFSLLLAPFFQSGHYGKVCLYCLPLCLSCLCISICLSAVVLLSLPLPLSRFRGRSPRGLSHPQFLTLTLTMALFGSSTTPYWIILIQNKQDTKLYVFRFRDVKVRC